MSSLRSGVSSSGTRFRNDCARQGGAPQAAYPRPARLVVCASRIAWQADDNTPRAIQLCAFHETGALFHVKADADHAATQISQLYAAEFALAGNHQQRDAAGGLLSRM